LVTCAKTKLTTSSFQSTLNSLIVSHRIICIQKLNDAILMQDR